MTSMTYQDYRAGKMPERRVLIGDHVTTKAGHGNYSGVVVKTEGRSFTPDALVRADTPGYVEEMAGVITGTGVWLVEVRQEGGRIAVLGEDSLIITKRPCYLCGVDVTAKREVPVCDNHH